MSMVCYVIVGGFLGAGKTTAALCLARHLVTQNRSVGLVTNDQSTDLVDTARVRAARLPVEEITGGCFCCEFDSLIERSKSLLRSHAPDVIVAEPVGSCTDLKATVSYPLRSMYGDQFAVAPFSVFVDPHRCAGVLGLWGDADFSEKVAYVYQKQLEEAEIIVIHKADLLHGRQRDDLLKALKQRFPAAKVLVASSHTGEGMNEWCDLATTNKLGHAPNMEVDYDRYAEGEALLGWFNGSGVIRAAADFDPDAFLLELTARLGNRLRRMGIQIAHLKLTLVPSTGDGLTSVSMVRNNEEPRNTDRLGRPLAEARLMVNLRAEAEPGPLKHVVLDELALLPHPFELGRATAFSPSRPTPRYRITAGERLNGN